MKKMFITKISFLIMTILFFILGVVTFDSYRYGICKTGNECYFSGWRFNISEPLIIIALSAGIVFLLSFFISSDTFKKWLFYFFSWLLVDIYWISQAKTTSSDYFGLIATKEDASIQMGFILVYTSLIWFALSKTQWDIWIKWLIAVPTFIIAAILTIVLI